VRRRSRKKIQIGRGGLALEMDVIVDETLPDEPEIRAALGRAMRRAVLRVQRAAVINASGGIVRARTGELAASVQADVAQRGLLTVGVVGPRGKGAFKGRILEQGAVAHVIRPRRRRRGRGTGALAINTGFRTIFRRGEVPHPGFARRPWFSRAIEVSQAGIRADFNRALQEAASA
jgi:hypothetical protein